MLKESSLKTTYYSDGMMVRDPELIESDSFLYLMKSGFIHESSGRINFCGFISFKNSKNQRELIVSFPKTTLDTPIYLNYDESLSKYTNFSPRLLFQVLDKYTGSKTNGYDEEGDHFVIDSNIRQAKDILIDWQLNGEMQDFLIADRKNAGFKVNWKKTIRKVLPFIVNDSIYYPDIFYYKNIKYDDSIIRQIHLEIVFECNSNYYWTITNSRFILDPITTTLNDDEKIAILKKRLGITFNDRSIRILNLLIQYIEAQSYESKKNGVYGTENFHVIWEQALCDVFSGDKSIEMPAVRWKNEKPENSSRQINPDFFYQDLDKNLWIVDAKYYDFKSGLPKGYDVIKQFFYSKFLEEKGKIIKKNMFLLPHNGQNKIFFDSVQLNYKKEIPVKEYKEIECWLLPVEKILRFYSENIKIDLLSFIINS